MAALDATCTDAACRDKGTYTVPGRCSNCFTEYEMTLTKGHDVRGHATCPNCGCDRVGYYPRIP